MRPARTLRRVPTRVGNPRCLRALKQRAPPLREASLCREVLTVAWRAGLRVLWVVDGGSERDQLFAFFILFLFLSACFLLPPSSLYCNVCTYFGVLCTCTVHALRLLFFWRLLTQLHGHVYFWTWGLRNMLDDAPLTHKRGQE